MGVAPQVRSPVKLVAVDMGYGHLRAAQALGDVIDQPVLYADRPPIADGEELGKWRRTRWFYESISRASQLGSFAGPFRSLLEGVTSIPHLHPYRDLSAPTLGVKGLRRMMRDGLGKGLIELLKSEKAGLLSTFYAPAIAADAAGCPRVTCVVTDADINRIWAPPEAVRSDIDFCVPSVRAKLRLQSYGVRPEKIHLTGFPLPGELLGGADLEALRRNLGRRLLRLDPTGTFRDSYRDEVGHFLGELPAASDAPPLVTFAVGGAGSQGPLALTLLESFKRDIGEGRLRLALVAATHEELAEEFLGGIKKLGLADQLGTGVRVLHEADLLTYFKSFNALLAETDVLFTKPSEMTFFAALGLPLVFSWPVGVHERYNRRWAIEGGAGLKQRDPRFANEWIQEWLVDGTLAGAAWSGFMRLPKFGLYRILEQAGLAAARVRDEKVSPPATPQSLAGN
jgi:hypothetical protein